MVVRIKELVVRYEDDGQESKLTAEEHKTKYRPLSLMVHHHCAPPKILTEGDLPVAGETAREITVDLSEPA